MTPLSEIFWNEGLSYANHSLVNSSLTGYRIFRSFFGVSPSTCECLWNLLENKTGTEPKYMLWCLLFLKQYNTEHLNASIVGVDEKTFRLWTWRFVELLAVLPVVKWNKRLKNPYTSKMYVSLDGTDFRIREPTPFNKKWYSHKFKSAGIRYEVGLSIGSGDIVWASGGLPCGEWPDIKIAKQLYIHHTQNEITLADKGYRDKKYFKMPSNKTEKRILARHETLNGRLKNFQILNCRFRHPLQKHPRVFHACVNIIQVSIENGETLFEL